MAVYAVQEGVYGGVAAGQEMVAEYRGRGR